MTNELLFFFSAIGVFNALVICFYLLLKRKSTYLILLGIFLFLLSFRVGISCIYFFNEKLPAVFIQLGLIANLLSALFLFVSISTSKNQLYRSDTYIVFITIISVLLFSIVYPFSSHFEIWDTKVRFVFHAILVIFLIGSWLRFTKLSKNDNQEYYIKRVSFIAFTLVCLSFAVSLFTNYIVGPILFSIAFYASLIYYFKINNEHYLREKYADKKIHSDVAELLISRLNSYVTTSKIYKNQDLRIQDVANNLQISRHDLTQLLNDNLGKSFSIYINEFRVEEAKKLLVSMPQLTIEAIGNEAGFKSKSTFFSSFKGITSTTPKAYKN